MEASIFELTITQLLDIAIDLEQKVINGLANHHQQIRCLPTYINTSNIPETGQAIVMDFGGTNIRAAFVTFRHGKLIIEAGPAATAIPTDNGGNMTQDQLLSIQAELISSLNPPDGLPFGYCFSYPAESTLDGDAQLIKWTKELFVSDFIGTNVGSMLIDYLKTYKKPVYCSKAVVINDTIASLFAGKAITKADGYIGLIVGTGNNMATFFQKQSIPKLPPLPNWFGPVPVNLESGNFYPPHLTPVDDELANNLNYSDLPAEQRFEKAVSGAYLGALMKLAMPESHVDPSLGSRDVVRIATNSSNNNNEEKELAIHILTRSAKLVAASLAGLIQLLDKEQSRKSICITAEGSLFWGYKPYKDITEETLSELLNVMNMQHIEFDIRSAENTNFLGSAIAALV